MPGFAIALLTLAAAAAVIRLRPTTALFILVLTTVLVPATLAVPFLRSNYLTVQHVLVLAGLLRLLVQPADRAAGRWAVRPTPAHVALGLLLVLAGVGGIALSPNAGRLGFAGFRLADLADQLAFFIVCLALVRRIGDVRRALGAAAVAVALSSLIAVGEHVTGASYGQWLFSRLPSQAGTDAALPLILRAGQTRARAGAEFALQFGWMSVTLLPALLACALPRRRGRLLAAAGLALVTLAVYWSFSRSALGSIVVVLVVLALVTADRRIIRLAGGSAVIGGAAYLAIPAVAARLTSAVDTGSLDVRAQRLGPILQAATEHPFRGLGLGELASSGFATTDNSLLLEYTELGVLGATALLVLFVVTLTQIAWALAVPDRENRLVAAACLTGGLVFVASAMTYDAFTLLQGSRLLWLLAAAATVLAEQHGAPLRLPRPRRLAVAGIGLVGLLVGLGALTVAPVHVARSFSFTTLPVSHESVEYDPVTTAGALVNSACGMLDARDAEQPDVSLDCENSFTAAGMGRLRIETATEAALDDEVAAISKYLRGTGKLAFFQLRAVDSTPAGRSTPWRTAPVWLPLGALGLLILVPWRRRAAPSGRPPGPAQPPPEHASAEPLPVRRTPALTAAPGP